MAHMKTTVSRELLEFLLDLPQGVKVHEASLDKEGDILRLVLESDSFDKDGELELSYAEDASGFVGLVSISEVSQP